MAANQELEKKEEFWRVTFSIIDHAIYSNIGIDEEMLILPVLILQVSMTGVELSVVVRQDSESLVIIPDSAMT